MLRISIRIAISQADGEDDVNWCDLDGQVFLSVDDAIAWLGAVERFEQRREERARWAIDGRDE